MALLSFDNLVYRFGEAIAWHCLFEIEKASGIRSNQSGKDDPEARLAYALHIQDTAHPAQIAA